ncbi:hypothetical protein [Mesorhizobium sp. USDA 4775]
MTRALHVLCNATMIESGAAFRNLRNNNLFELLKNRLSGDAQPNPWILLGVGGDHGIFADRVAFDLALTQSKNLQPADVPEPDEQGGVTNMRRKIPPPEAASRRRDPEHSVRSCVVGAVYSRCSVAGRDAMHTQRTVSRHARF